MPELGSGSVGEADKPVVVLEEKPIYLSKTFWANVLLVLGLPFLPDPIKVFVQDPEKLAAIFGVVNLVLRFISKDKVTLY